MIWDITELIYHTIVIFTKVLWVKSCHRLMAFIWIDSRLKHHTNYYHVRPPGTVIVPIYTFYDWNRFVVVNTAYKLIYNSIFQITKTSPSIVTTKKNKRNQLSAVTRTNKKNKSDYQQNLLTTLLRTILSCTVWWKE